MRYPRFALTTLLLVLLLGLTTAPHAAEAQAPETISYQGFATAGSGTPLDGLHNFTFTLYDAQSGGNQVWSESQNGVSITDGHFQVSLGSETSFASQDVTFEEPYWLEIEVNDGTTAQTLQPRTKLESTPYANAAHTLDLPVTLRADESGSAMKVINQSGAAAEFRNRTIDDAGYESRVRIGSSVALGALGTSVVSTGVRTDSATIGFMADTTFFGLYISNAFQSGLKIDNGFYGISIDAAGYDAVRIGSAERDGISVNSAGSDGVYVNEASKNGFRVNSAGEDGLYVLSAGDYGVYVGEADTDGDGRGKAGYFDGDVEVTGTLEAGTKNFKIDHPLDPAGMYLRHAAVESPEMKTVYDGTVTTGADGYATVQLPDYFQALNGDFRYQLTPIGTFTQAIVAEEVSGTTFVVRTEKPNVKVSWQVTGVREDAWAKEHPLQVEEEKPARER